MIRTILRINLVLVAALAVAFLVYPATRLGLDLLDPAIRRPGIPKVAWRLYKHLAPRYEAWAKKRIETGPPDNLATNDIATSERPLVGSVFFLWAVENLEDAWKAGDRSVSIEPSVFASNAVIAASNLVLDPKEASWVKSRWGEDYLHREDVSYRLLLIAAATARERLCGDSAYRGLLRDQVESLAKELDQSKHGLLDNYPGECHPGDVMAALLCIHRADVASNTNDSAWLDRALRGFVGSRATRYGLPPYSANSRTGLPTSGPRGCSNSYICLSAPELWPPEARRWFAMDDRFFWQERWGAVGYREFPKGVSHSDWRLDVDAGPVLAGYGIAANAFAVGASRKNGRFDRAYPLTSELLASLWQLPTGELLLPLLLSSHGQAPLLAETTILWQLSIGPEKGMPLKTGGRIPTVVYIVLIAALFLGAWRVLESVVGLRQLRGSTRIEVKAAGVQAALWICLLAAAALAFRLGHAFAALAAVILAVLLPIRRKPRPPKGVEDWDQNAAAGPSGGTTSK